MKRILSIKVETMPDESPDLSYFGEYSNKPGPDDRTIDRQERGDWQRGQCRYFIAGMSGAETGNPESVEQDYQRMEAYNRGDFHIVGIRAKAEFTLRYTQEYIVQTVRSGGLWGIESDSDESYIASIHNEELAGLRGQLLEVGFTNDQIDAAINASGVDALKVGAA